MRHGQALTLHVSLCAAFAGAGLLAACGTPPPASTAVTPAAAAASSAPGAKAFAELKPTSGQTASGIVWFEQRGDQVQVSARVAGLKPGQEHGFHVHEKGDCSAPDATSAGGHLNPTAKPHGGPGAEHHAGDMPSLKADASGVAKVSFLVPGTVTGSGAADFVGKAVVVHADRDDYATQPSGNSGARIGCGVILVPTTQSTPGAPKGVPNEM
jgi:superoxide dismutase, Cu-Zn family